MGDEKQLAIEVIRALQERGHIGFLVGGCVRDQLMGVRQPKDYDVVTSASPEELEEWFSKTVAVGKSFGTITVVKDDAQVQVSTLRNCTQRAHTPPLQRPDTQNEIARLLKDDAGDRDFTFNALFLDPISQDVYDFFGGKEDLRQGVVRTVGDPTERFRKDRLRMMRAVRMSAYYGFSIEPVVMQALRQLAAEIADVSLERVRDEVKKILTCKRPVAGLDLLMDTGLMQHVLPEVVELDSERGEQDPIWHPEGTVWVHSRLVLEELKGSSFELMFGGLLHDIGKPDTQERSNGRISNRKHAEVGAQIARKICTRFKMSNEESDRVCALVAMHMKMHDVRELRSGKLADLLDRPDIEDLIALQHADSVGTECDCRFDKSCRDFLEDALADHRKQEFENPFIRIVTGDVLISMGFKPGPSFREILDEAACAQREGVFDDVDAGMSWVRQNYS